MKCTKHSFFGAFGQHTSWALFIMKINRITPDLQHPWWHKFTPDVTRECSVKFQEENKMKCFLRNVAITASTMSEGSLARNLSYVAEYQERRIFHTVHYGLMSFFLSIFSLALQKCSSLLFIVSIRSLVLFFLLIVQEQYWGSSMLTAAHRV